MTATDEPTVTAERVVPPVLRVTDLAVEFATDAGPVRVVRDVALDVVPGQTLAILGESGSGKSVTAHAIMGLVAPPGKVINGHVQVDGNDVPRPERGRRPAPASGLAMIFQDSLTALDPSFTVGNQVAEILQVRRGLSRRAARSQAVRLLNQVQIPDPARRASAYPHQLSGGMRQRVAIAMALAIEPKVLIADEPTTALDVTIQAQIMTLLTTLQQENGMALVLITHDLGVVFETADTVAVMYAGRIVERGTAAEVLQTPAHPYTRALMRSTPRLGAGNGELWAIPGTPPNPAALPPGCAFAPRCDAVEPRCHDLRPELTRLGSSREVACHRAKDVISGRA